MSLNILLKLIDTVYPNILGYICKISFLCTVQQIVDIRIKLLLQSVLVGLFIRHCSGKVPMLLTLETRPERVAETEPNLIFISFVIHVIALLCSILRYLSKIL